MKSERNIKSKIMIEISKRGGFPLNQSVGTFLTIDGHRVVHIGINGLTDLLAVLPDGKVAWIETKAASGGQKREDQIKFIERIKELGHRAGFAKSVDDAIKILEGIE
jgi:hypothetical protein